MRLPLLLTLTRCSRAHVSTTFIRSAQPVHTPLTILFPLSFQLSLLLLYSTFSMEAAPSDKPHAQVRGSGDMRGIISKRRISNLPKTDKPVLMQSYVSAMPAQPLLSRELVEMGNMQRTGLKEQGRMDAGFCSTIKQVKRP